MLDIDCDIRETVLLRSGKESLTEENGAGENPRRGTYQPSSYPLNPKNGWAIAGPLGA
jgi:hypothetical protein